MNINLQNVKLSISAGRPEQFPRKAIPQIAFSGRSNVGKSSLINALLGRKSLARVSSAPGKTITINFYEIDGKCFLADLPGYGFARRPPDEKAAWSALTDGYFTANPNRDLLRLVVQLIDAKVGATKDDLQMLEWLAKSDISFVIATTKNDKLSKAAQSRAMDDLFTLPFVRHAKEIISCSSETRVGCQPLWNAILKYADLI